MVWFKKLAARISGQISLRTLFVVPFVVQLAAAVGLTGWLSFHNGQIAVNDLATKLRNEVTLRIQEQLHTYLAIPQRVNQLDANAIKLGELDIRDKPGRERHFRQRVATFDLISHHYMGTPGGEYFGAKRLLDGSLQIMFRDKSSGANQYYDTDSQGKRTKLVKTAPNYDARTRPWYKAAVNAGKPAWSALYSDFTTKALAITAVHPLYNESDELQGVLGSSLIFSWVNEFLSSLEIGKSGQTFIMERSGMLVATSTRDPVLRVTLGNHLERIDTTGSENPLIRGAARHLRTHFGSLDKIEGSHQLNFDLDDGERQFLQATPLRDEHGLDWLIVVLVPESDFMEYINATTRNTIWLCLGALLLAIIGGLQTSRWVTRPILRLNASAGALAKGEWQKTVQIDRKDELGELASSFNSMAAQLKASFESLEHKNADLRTLDKLKDEFLANTSHELRTPLNGIIGIAESMFDGAVGPLSEPQKKNLQMIAQSGHRLTNLVNDILDFSKLKHKNIELQLRPVGLREITEVVLILNQALVGQKALKLVNKISPELPAAEADENRLQQILHNLIANAIKFSDQGSVEISAKIVDKPANDKKKDKKKNKKYIAITVSDSGIGIPEDKLDTIFQSFQQADGSTAREYGGTGLGLAVTKQLVKLHKGKIWVESASGAGSRFTFTLPVSGKEAQPVTRGKPSLLSSQPAMEAEDAAPSVPAKTGSGEFNILIVDDEPVNLQVLVNHLVVEDYAVTQAADGLEALDLIEQGFKPDLMLLDVMMPKMTGYEVCRRLRQKYPANELPVLMLTAKNQAANLVEGLDAGANDYLTKPVSKPELLARIKTHIHLAKINLAYGRFVPRQFIQFMDKQSVVEVKLGDHTQKEMSVLFSDIRGFTSLSEAMSPQENFDFINAYLSRMEPIISKHQGFIDKYIGDAIMALFPTSADHAVQASIGMLLKLDEYNLSRGRPGRPVLKIGIGLHTGSLMLGTVGGKDRMDGTVISDAVNLASRTEGLTKIYGTALLITEHTYRKLQDASRYKIRVVDRVKVKGKTQAVTVYEVFDADPPELVQLKSKTLADFELGFECYHRQDLDKAHGHFDKVLKVNEHDEVTRVYLDRCNSLSLLNKI
ncbi:MAG: response regulator [Gammaproteobacteria bacterium]|nr:response regulator [Gammaproteobacteria bacterium]